VSTRPILGIRIGDVHGTVELTMIVPTIERICAFWRFVITVSRFGSRRITTKGDSVFLENFSVGQQN
jgi:hypothetical protein